MIRLTNIKKHYETKDGIVEALNGVDLTVENGEIFGVIGYSGAGKSTLIRLINMLETPTEGKVEVDGQVLSSLPKRELRKAREQIGMIFQHFNLLWSRTVRENIAFSLEIAKVPRKQREARVNELLKLVGLEGRGDSYPSQLSGGQKQRVGIARALANDPKVLLCDEATSALDPKTTTSILELLVDINEKLGLTIVLITHEMHVIRKICHRVAVIDHGQIVEEGQVLDIFKQPKLPVTKDFVKQITDMTPSDNQLSLLDIDPEDGTLVKLTFVGQVAQKPLVNELVHHFPTVELNILQGSISKTRGGSYGTLYVQLSGGKQDVMSAIEFIDNQGVQVEVIDDALTPLS